MSRGALTELLDRLAELGEREQTVSVGKIRETVGNRSFGPFLLVPALIEMSPIGGIPGLPTVIAAVIILIAFQLLLGKEHVWLPAFLRRRTLNGDKLAAGARKLRPVTRWADKVVRPRLRWLTKGPWLPAAAATCILLAATTPLLEFIPFASTIPMAGIALIGLGLLARDGLVLLVAAALPLSALGLWGASMLQS